MKNIRSASLKVLIAILKITDSDGDTLGEKNDHVNIEEKRGFIKEYIETEGSGIIFSQ